jgi:V/A-type H+-transporting ATPase subunit E
MIDTNSMYGNVAEEQDEFQLIQKRMAENAKKLAEAKKKADSIVANAKAEAQQVRDASEKEIAILKESAAVSAEQAKRDAVLAFKTEIQGEFEKILAAGIGKELSGGEGLGKLIRAAVAGENVADLAAEVSEVSDALKSELAAEIKHGLEIRPTKSVQSGFRLAAKDGSGYFDCSDDGIMEMLMPYFRNLDFQ